MEKNKKIVLIGCGNIGSRHLQAIIKVKSVTSVEIVEPNIKSQKTAKLRLNKIEFNKLKQKIFWNKSLSTIKNQSDLVIVATNSKGRVDLIQKLLELGHRKFIVEKMVCQSVEEYKKLLFLFKKFNAKGWVNTNRRYFKSYQNIKTRFANSENIHLSVFASNSGLGTNAIHFLDLFSWLSEEYKIKLNGEFLEDKIVENKRGGNFKEFVGTIIGFSKNSFVSTIYNWLSQKIFRVPVSDLNSMKAFRTEILTGMYLRHDWHRFFVVMAYHRGYSVDEIAIELFPRRAGVSKYSSPLRIIPAIIDMISVWFLLIFSRKPLILFGFSGFVLIISGILVGVLAFYFRFALSSGFRPLLYLVILLETVGFLMLGFGLVAEMIAQVREELQGPKQGRQ